MRYELKRAYRYLRVVWWAVWAALATGLRLPVAEDWSDYASLHALDCSLDFVPVEVVGSMDEKQRRELAFARRGEVVAGSGRPVAPKDFRKSIGFSCGHFSITTGGDATLVSVTGWCGCDMRPLYA
jgi:hypothetical protein